MVPHHFVLFCLLYLSIFRSLGSAFYSSLSTLAVSLHVLSLLPPTLPPSLILLRYHFSLVIIVLFFRDRTPLAPPVIRRTSNYLPVVCLNGRVLRQIAEGRNRRRKRLQATDRAVSSSSADYLGELLCTFSSSPLTSLASQSANGKDENTYLCATELKGEGGRTPSRQTESREDFEFYDEDDGEVPTAQQKIPVYLEGTTDNSRKEVWSSPVSSPPNFLSLSLFPVTLGQHDSCLSPWSLVCGYVLQVSYFRRQPFLPLSVSLSLPGPPAVCLVS